MNKYTIFCTEEQTKKALELGAPIETQEYIGGELYNDWCSEDDKCYHIPTSEQMISWLEDQNIIREVNVYRSANYEGWYYSISGSDKQYITINDRPIASVGKYNTRKEATIASIDSALEYLKNNKK